MCFFKCNLVALHGGATEEHDVMRRAQEGPRYGEQGYRYHAIVPATEAMDYTIRPKLKIDPSEIKAGQYKFANPVDPQLESARFQPLSL